MERNNSKSSIKFLKKCDLFENPITLSYNENCFYKTNIGGFLSLLDIIIIVGYFVINIEEIIGYNSYTISQIESYNINNIINFTSVPFAFKLTTSNGTDIIYDQKIFTYKIVQINSKNSFYEENNIEFENCKNYFQYNEKYSYLKKYNSESLMCIKPNQNLEMKGVFEDTLNEFKGFRIYIIKCNKENCFNDMNEKLNDIKFNFYFLGYSIRHNKDFKNILINKLFSYSVNLSRNYIKKYYFNFKSSTYNYYNGNLYNSINTKYFFLYDKYTLDIENNNNINNVIAYFSFNNKGTNIEYTKKCISIWNIIDKFGGLMYVIITISKIINNFISRKILFIDLYENIDIKESPKTTNYLSSKQYENNHLIMSIDNLRKPNLVLNNTKENNCYDMSSENFKNFKTVLFNPNRLNIRRNIINNNDYQKSKFGSCVLNNNVRLIGNNLITNNIINNQKKKKKEIIKKHLYFFFIFPSCIIERTKTFEYLPKIKKQVSQYYSIENFAKVVELEKHLKNNPSRCSSCMKS